MPLALLLATATAGAAPIGPAQAIAALDAAPRRPIIGRFEMTVASAEQNGEALFLNSSSDYRAPDSLTFV